MECIFNSKYDAEELEAQKQACARATRAAIATCAIVTCAARQPPRTARAAARRRARGALDGGDAPPPAALLTRVRARVCVCVCRSLFAWQIVMDVDTKQLQEDPTSQVLSPRTLSLFYIENTSVHRKGV